MSCQKFLALLPCAVFCAALSTPAAAQTESGTQSGMVVVRDAQTGQLRAPTAAESRALAPAPTAAASAMRTTPPALTTHPSGSRQVRLGERALVYSVVTRGPDGKLVEQCVQGAAAAEKAVGAPASTQHKQEHRHD